MRETPAQAGVATAHVGEVAVVTLNRPDVLNALDLAAWRVIAATFATLGDARAVVLRGAGARAFSAGANIAEFQEERMSAAGALAYNRAIAAALEAVAACPAPVIAMVHGAAVGGGCELVAACDVRVAAADARFGIPIGRLGVTLGVVEARALVRLIGPARLKELVFSGRLIDATEARAIGLVERVAEPDALLDTTLELLEAILAASPTTIRATKHVVGLVERDLTHGDVDALAQSLFDAYEGDDLREGVAAFLAHRPPQFTAAATTEDPA
jgi:enoyl-CoA hydratase